MINTLKNTINDALDDLENYMESLQKNPQKVANFFLHPSVKYAS